MLERISTLAIRRARVVLVLATVAVVAMAMLGFGAFDKLQTGGFNDPDAPSSRARDLIDDKFGGQPNLLLLVQASNGLNSAAARRSSASLTKDLRSEPTVSQVTSYLDPGAADLIAKDGSRALVLAHVRGEEEQIADRTRALLDRYAKDRPGIRVQGGGEASVGVRLGSQVTQDLTVAESIAVPVTLVLLIVAFGSLVAALLPLVIGLIAILGTFAELSLLGSLTDVSVFAINLTTALGLGLGIDYALLLVSRFREQLLDGHQVPDALRHTVRTAGRTIAFSAATVAVALTAMLIFPLYFLRSFAYAGIGVVAVAAVSALVVMPALLVVLGERVNRGRLPWMGGVRRAESPLWGRLAAVVMRRPALTALPVVGVLLLVASPLLGVAFGIPDETVLPPGSTARQVADSLRRDFRGNESDAIQVVIDGPVAPAALATYARELSRQPTVVRVSASVGNYTDGQSSPAGPPNAALARPDAQRLTVTTEVTPGSGAAGDLVRALRTVPAPGDARTLVGGGAAQIVDTHHAIGSRLPIAIALVAGTTFVLLFLFTGSVVQPLRALVLNAISLSAAIGAMVWIFQDGHLSSMLGFTARPMDTSMTVLMFCITFGLSMDYEVFLTSRIKELHDAGADPAEAVSSGLSHTGRIVTMAAGLLAVSFFAFGTSKVSFLQMFGLGSGLAVLVDAVAVRGVLVPATMRLLGRSAWYAPEPLRKLHGKVALREVHEVSTGS